MPERSCVPRCVYLGAQGFGTRAKPALQGQRREERGTARVLAASAISVRTSTGGAFRRRTITGRAWVCVRVAAFHPLWNILVSDERTGTPWRLAKALATVETR